MPPLPPTVHTCRTPPKRQREFVWAELELEAGAKRVRVYQNGNAADPRLAWGVAVDAESAPPSMHKLHVEGFASEREANDAARLVHVVITAEQEGAEAAAVAEAALRGQLAGAGRLAALEPALEGLAALGWADAKNHILYFFELARLTAYLDSKWTEDALAELAAAAVAEGASLSQVG